MHLCKAPIRSPNGTHTARGHIKYPRVSTIAITTATAISPAYSHPIDHCQKPRPSYHYFATSCLRHTPHLHRATQSTPHPAPIGGYTHWTLEPCTYYICIYMHTHITYNQPVALCSGPVSSPCMFALPPSRHPHTFHTPHTTHPTDFTRPTIPSARVEVLPWYLLRVLQCVTWRA